MEVNRLAAIIAKFKTQPAPTQSVPVVTKTTSERASQTTPIIQQQQLLFTSTKCVNAGTQTSSSIVVSSESFSTAASSSINRSTVEWRRELESERERWSRERAEAQEEANEREAELIKCELACLNERTQVVWLQSEIAELGDKIKQLSDERDTHKTKLVKLEDAYRIEKQVSGTIIQQQKKLLDYLQVMWHIRNSNYTRRVVDLFV